MKQKLINLFFFGLLAISFVSCGSNNNKIVPTPEYQDAGPRRRELNNPTNIERGG